MPARHDAVALSSPPARRPVPGTPATAVSAALGALARSGAAAGSEAEVGLGAARARDAGTAAAPAVRAEGLTKVHGSGDTSVVALDAVSLEVPRGQFTAVMGPSGSGKSTLMHCLAGLDPVTSGRVVLGDTDVTRMRDRELTRLRRDRVGFVFQAFNLVPTLSAEENILLPLALAGRTPDAEWFAEVVDAVGLAGRLHHRPAALSGGQQQRVACARALVGRPEVVFADEPTGNLDSAAGREVLGLLRRSVDDLGQTVVMVTHDPAAASWTDRVVFLADGRLVGDLAQPTVDGVHEQMRAFERRGAVA